MKLHVAFQRALAGQLAAIRIATPGVCAGDADALHDWRVAVRRLRTMLRVLPGKQARAIGAESLQNEWRAWSRKFGPARDADVWHETLQDPALRKALGATAEGRTFLRTQERRRKALQTPLRRLLRSAKYRRLLLRTEILFSRELPARLDKIGSRRLARSVRQAFSRLLVRARRRARRLPDAGGEAAAAHELRRLVRRARYLSEMGRRIVPAASPRLRKLLSQIQSALGEVHDADVQLAQIGNLPPAVAHCVRDRIRRRRTDALRVFRQRRVSLFAAARWIS